MAIPANLFQALANTAQFQTALNGADYGGHGVSDPMAGMGQSPDISNLFQGGGNWSVDPNAQPPAQLPTPSAQNQSPQAMTGGLPGANLFTQGPTNPGLVTNQYNPNFSNFSNFSASAPATTNQPPASTDPYNIPALLAAKTDADTNQAKAAQDLLALKGPPDAISASQLIGGKNTRRDLLTGLLPLAVSLLFGKKGQEFAGGFIPGWLQGKGQQAQLQNANNQQAYQAQYQKKATALQIAQQQSQSAAQDLKIANDAKRYELQYGPGAAKYLSTAMTQAQQTIKSSSSPQARYDAGVQQKKIFDDTNGLMGVDRTEEQLQALMTPRPGDALKEAQKDKVTEETKNLVKKGLILDDLHKRNILLDPIKATKMTADIAMLNARIKDIPIRTQIMQDFYRKRGDLTDQQIAEAAVTTALMPLKFEKEMQGMYNSLAENADKQDIELAKMAASDRALVAKHITDGLKSVNDQIKALQTLKSKVVVPDEEYTDEEDHPHLDTIAAYDSQINALKRQLKALNDQSENILKGVGYNPDGTPMTEGQQKIIKHQAKQYKLPPGTIPPKGGTKLPGGGTVPPKVQIIK